MPPFLRSSRTGRAAAPAAATQRFDAARARHLRAPVRAQRAVRRASPRPRLRRATPAASWHEIPAVPTAAFKEATLATFDVRRRRTASFETSGTTGGRRGPPLHGDAPRSTTRRCSPASTASCCPTVRELRYLNLVPEPAQRAALVARLHDGHVSARAATARPATSCDDERVDVEGLSAALAARVRREPPRLHRHDGVRARRRARRASKRANAPSRCRTGSRIMETGGFKGRSRVVDARRPLRAARGRASASPDVDRRRVRHDRARRSTTTRRESRSAQPRVKLAAVAAPPIVDAEDAKSRPATSARCVTSISRTARRRVAIQTEDRALRVCDERLRPARARAGAAPRGCSLDAEDLARAH